MRIADTKHHTPRAAHCIGCGVTFDKMHQMINHRRTERCGGRFLSESERELVDAGKFHQQKYEQLIGDRDEYDTAKWHFMQSRDMVHRFHLLRRYRMSGRRMV